MTTITEKIKQKLTLIGSKTPLYVFDDDRFIDNVRNLEDAFRKIYNNYNVAYSYKTNPHKLICSTAKGLGCYAEVVSPSEYQLAISLGIPSRNIIYNGVIPDVKNKFNCALCGGKVNIDNLHELLLLNEYASRRKEIIKVGIRVSFPLSEGQTSKFGFDINGNEFKQLMTMQLSNIRIVGLHCHISGHRSSDQWKHRVKSMLKIVDYCYGPLIERLEYLDLGGNMYGNMEQDLKNQFQDVPSFYEYANAVATEMKKSFPDQSVELITENGTSSVGDCVSILARVIGVKESYRRKKYICDTSYYDCGFLVKTKAVPYEIINVGFPNFEESCDIVGYACTEEDFLVRNYSGQIAVGDFVLLKNLGAYAYSVSSDFIQPKHNLVTV